MNTNFLLMAEGGNGTGGTVVMLVVLAVLFIGMMLLSIIPQKKRQKKAQEMMNSIRVGTTIKTIGGFVGVIKEIDNQHNAFVIDISANHDGAMLVTIDKNAVYNVIATPDGVPVSNETAEAAQNVAADDKVADEVADEKKAKKRGKKNREAFEEAEATAEEGGEVVDNDAVTSDGDSEVEGNTTGIDSSNDLTF